MAKNIELVRQEVAAMRSEVEDFANSAERVGGVVSDVLEYSHAEAERAQSAEELISQQAEQNFKNFSELGVEESAKIDGYEIALMKKTNTARKTKVKVPVYDMQNPSATPVGLVDEVFVEDMKAEAKKMMDAEAERAKAAEGEIRGSVESLGEDLNAASEDISKLEVALEAETSRAQAAEQALSTEITEAENRVDEHVTEVRDSLEDEVQARNAAVADLNDNTGISEYPTFDSAKAYAVGDVVKYEGGLKRFTAEHVAGEWIGTDAEKWSERNEREDVYKKVNEKINNIDEELIGVGTKVTDITDTMISAYGNSCYITEEGKVSGAGGRGAALIFNVEGMDYVTIEHWFFSDTNATRAYAFYDKEQNIPFYSEHYISGSSLYPASSSNYKIKHEDIPIPGNAKTLVVIAYIEHISVQVKKVSKGRTIKGEISEAVESEASRAKSVEASLTEDIALSIALSTEVPNVRKKIFVKKDGSGDFTTIQGAINSITDMSITNQYDIMVCDDYTITNMRELHLVNNPLEKNTNANPTSPVAAVITKNWVNIIGYRRRVTVSVLAPYDLEGASFQHIQTMFLQGNCVVDNIDFVVKNGRYAIHQESGGSKDSQDYNAKTILRNCKAIHLGNKDSADGGVSWPSVAGQANGMCPGLELYYENVIWSPSFYTHCNTNFESKNKVSFKNCSIIYDRERPSLTASYIETLGNGQNLEIYVEGCNMQYIGVKMDVRDTNVITDAVHDVRTFIPNYLGQGNNTILPRELFAGICLGFITQDNAKSVKVIGGSALNDIYGDDLLRYDGTSDAKGFIVGTEYIAISNGNYAFTLAHRLGNCASNPKSLVIEVDGSQQTIVLDKNFVTDDGSSYTAKTVPAYSNNDVVSYINSQLNGVSATISDKLNSMVMFPFCDQYEIGYNNTSNTIYSGAAVKMDIGENSLSWRNCETDEKPDGIACQRINSEGGSGKIALLDKCKFMSIYDSSLTNNYAKAGVGGRWVNATEADAILVKFSKGHWRLKK